MFALNLIRVCSRQESNLYQGIRNPSFYPLNYGSLRFQDSFFQLIFQAFLAIVALLERWLSGRKRHTANVLSLYRDRGFESHPLRKNSEFKFPPKYENSFSWNKWVVPKSYGRYPMYSC